MAAEFLSDQPESHWTDYTCTMQGLQFNWAGGLPCMQPVRLLLTCLPGAPPE